VEAIGATARAATLAAELASVAGRARVEGGGFFDRLRILGHSALGIALGTDHDEKAYDLF
jgi:hypothetical protein